MIRGAAAAGLSLTLGLTGLGLIGASALAGPASAAPATATGTAGTTGAAATSASLPNPTTQDCDPQPRYKAQTGTPWAQRVLDYRDVWQYTQGAGVTVAVIDSGVDGNPQFNNRVSEGRTLVKSQSGPADCVGHGTMVAGIIAAAPTSGTSFVGVAPQAHILSIKVAEKDAGISSGTLAQAINQAVSAGVQVINVSIDTPTPDSRLQAAVNNALSHNIVVVAAVGNDEQPDGSGNADSSGATHGPFYPADYQGVLSVGALDSQGNLAPFSDKQTQVGVTAPGMNITSTFPGVSGDSYAADDGTSFAAPFVSGVAALVRSRYPAMSTVEVVRRIEETADGPAGTGTGNGLVNPVQAVTAVLPPGTAPSAGPQTGAVTVDRAVSQHKAKVVAASLAGGALAVAAAVIAAVVVIPAGRKRRWRPGT